MNEVRDIAAKCLRDEAQAILDLIPQLDSNFDQAVNLILSCTGKVIITGVGKSGHIGAKMAATLSSTGTPAFFINPLDVFHGDLGVITPCDVVVAISLTNVLVPVQDAAEYTVCRPMSCCALCPTCWSIISP